MNKKPTYVLLGVIVLIAALLRLHQFGSVPPSPDWDEAALGYNAYSVLLTGKDEYGTTLPVVLRSFDDYKPALYMYFVIPFVKLFGLNIVSVRLPSALFGIATVLLLYFLVKKLFSGKEIIILNKKTDPKYLALISAFLLSISPWHIQFSRIAFESNVGLALNVITFLLFLYGLKNPKLLVLSFIAGALNIYEYQSEKVFTPLMLLALIIIYHKELLKINKKWIAASVLTALLVAIPMIHFTLTDKNALLRARGVSIFADQTNFLKRNVEKLKTDKSNNDLVGYVLDNRRVEFAKTIIAGYIYHFNINWLFINGDTTGRHHAPQMGLMYLFELPLLLIGTYQLVFGNLNKKARLAIAAYILLVPIPASVTSGVPHAVRTLNVLGILQIITGLGLLTFVIGISRIKYQILKIKIRYLIFALYISFFIFNFVYYLNQYFVQQNYFVSQDWQYGYKEATSFIKPIMNKYDKIIVSNEPFLDQSYMFFLYYFQFDPEKYQDEGGTGSGGFREEHKGFLNMTFRPLDWTKPQEKGRVLYVGRPQDIPGDVNTLKTVNYLNGKPAIVIFEK